MSNEQKTEFTLDEMRAWVPPPCPRCGKSDRVRADWVPAGGFRSPEVYLLGLLDCPCQREQIQASIFD